MSSIFIAGSRTISAKKIVEIAKKHIVKDNIIWGVLEEEYIEGFNGQPHFKTLEQEKLQYIVDEFQKLKLKHTITILTYPQENLPKVLHSLTISKAIFVNASWKIAFPRRPEYQVLKAKGIKPKFISPFIDENEARAYADKMHSSLSTKYTYQPEKSYTDIECMQCAHNIACRSFDYTWQTGAVLAREGYILYAGHNRILPYETAMWINGSLKEHGLDKEKDESQLHNLNTNETLHAEMDILTQALNSQANLEGTTMYVSLMPCPNCARAIAATNISRIVYEKEHFGGIAERILRESGKSIVRMDSIEI